MDKKAEIRETAREKEEHDRKEEPPIYSLTYSLVKERGTGKPNLPSRKLDSSCGSRNRRDL